MHADPARRAKEWELDVWTQFELYSPVRMGSESKDVVDPERSKGREDSKSAISGERLSGPGSSKWQCRYHGAREPEIAPLATDTPGGIGVIGDFESGHQARLYRSGWL